MRFSFIAIFAALFAISALAADTKPAADKRSVAKDAPDAKAVEKRWDGGDYGGYGYGHDGYGYGGGYRHHHGYDHDGYDYGRDHYRHRHGYGGYGYDDY